MDKRILELTGLVRIFSVFRYNIVVNLCLQGNPAFMGADIGIDRVFLYIDLWHHNFPRVDKQKKDIRIATNSLWNCCLRNVWIKWRKQ